MKVNYRISDFIFLGILGLMIISSIFRSLIFGYHPSITNYLGFISWTLAIILMFTRFRFQRYSLAILLALGTFRILNFGFWTASITFTISGFTTPGIDFLIFLILVAYTLVNRETISRVLLSALHGSPEEQQLKEEKEIAFYTRKFEKCTKEELEEVFSNYKDYPWAAKQAIDNITRTGNVNDLSV